jgi:hypothetical protein
VVDEYRAVINLDYTRPNNAGYQRILNALDGAGWDYVETSAMAYEGDLDGIRLGLEVLARALPTGGTVSAVTIQIQRIGAARPTPGAQRPENALDAVLGMDLPSA